ncbi:MAG: hypothetical protein DMG39_03900 [Acidobacteria bacterium]|nr:MAG: hypothetical protein DMG39_03900 [Acidobacteriota bacterium]
MTSSEIDRSQIRYARLAGFLFLWLIMTGLGGLFLNAHIVGSGAFDETAKRVAASEHLYRVALCLELIETMSAALLAFALYVTLKPVDPLLAQLAMYWRLGESFLGAAGMMGGFVRLGLYISPKSIAALGAEQSQALVGLTGDAGFASYNISAAFFGIGSILFFYLFFKSSYIPRTLSVFGVFASVLVPIMCFGTLVFPGSAGVLQYGWAPMAVAEVTTGIWLMVKGVNRQPQG